MKVVDEAKLSELDALCDSTPMPASVADEVFAVVDVLDSAAGLRRALTDPASSADARVALGERVFGQKVSSQAQQVLQGAFGLRWRNGSSLSDALERQGVRIVLQAAARDGVLDEVISGLYGFESVVRAHHGLREALRDNSFDVTYRRGLVDKLVAGKTSAYAVTLLRRAVAARARTYQITLDGYLGLAAALRERQIAHVTVARPLAADQEHRLRTLLAKQAGRDIDLQIEVDPDVLGGIRVQFGDDRIESTVAARLEDVQRQLTS